VFLSKNEILVLNAYYNFIWVKRERERVLEHLQAFFFATLRVHFIQNNAFSFWLIFSFYLQFLVWLVLCVMFCRSLFFLFLLTIVLSVHLQYMDSEFPFGIFRLFLSVIFTCSLWSHHIVSINEMTAICVWSRGSWPVSLIEFL
jgi:hypothetical protein